VSHLNVAAEWSEAVTDGIVSAEPVEVSLAGSRNIATDLAALRSWLSNEKELRGRISAGKPTDAPSEMGSVSDVLVVALGSGGALTVLINSLAIWLRNQRSELFVELTRPDGSKIKFGASGPVAQGFADPPTEE
jgi:hypothetical protein